MKKLTLLLVLVGSIVLILAGSAGETSAVQDDRIFIRTENYPRPPYSGATYYIYERGGETICTKLKVCNKYDNCSTNYYNGVFKEVEDVETGEPYDKTDPVLIPKNKLRRHVCLKKYVLNK
jgi:hypothetical protein